VLRRGDEQELKSRVRILRRSAMKQNGKGALLPVSHAIIKEFDTLTSEISFNHCYCCKRVVINLCMASQSTEAVCSDCKTYTNFDPIQDNLPVWFSADGQPMYHVPNELSCL
jgi:hypothetical protein